MIKYIFFDIDNTLYDYEICNAAGISSALLFISKSTGISINELSDSYKKARSEVKNQLGNVASSHSRLQYFKRMNEIIFNNTNSLDCLKANNIFWTNYFNNMSLVPGIKNFLKTVNEANITCVAATNLTTDIQFRKLSKLGISNMFDFVITSEDAGHEKPSEGFVNYLKLIIGFEDGDHSWFIGDDITTDLPTAKLLGSKAFIRLDRSDINNISQKDYVGYKDINKLQSFVNDEIDNGKK
tara:strand:- start:17824 stop:18543 length:720 start_codon:yes stop_codon:yes gene_type:complete